LFKFPEGDLPLYITLRDRLSTQYHQDRWPCSFVLQEVAPGFTAREVQELTEMEIVAGPAVGTMD
jgi:hypothetical protein